MKFINGVAPPVMAATALLLGLPLAQPVSAFNLGAANDYNVFVFGDVTQTGSTDVEGRLAAGGNVFYGTTDGIAVNSDLLPNSPAPLVVGGNLELSNGQVNGDALVGGTVSNPSNIGATITGSLTAGGSSSGVNAFGGTAVNDPDVGSSLSNFFTSSYNYLTGLSGSLQGLSTTGTVQNNWGGLSLTGSNTSTNVFNLTGAQLTGLNNLTIDAPSGSTVVVNVDGDFTLQNHAMNLLGIGREDVLFNLFNASTANIGTTSGGFSFQGSLLAPGVDVFGYNGNFEGTLVANSFTGTLEAHNYQFAGTLPVGGAAPSSAAGPSAAVPTPALLPGLLGFAAAMRKRYRQAAA